MTFDGSEGAPITLPQASQFTAAWRSQFPGLPMGFATGKNILLQILQQDGAMGLRIYNAINDEGNMAQVICAYDKSGNDILELISDWSNPCPPRCGVANPLNS